MNLSAEFVNKVKRVWGEDGEKWAAAFPEALSACVTAWELENITPLSNLSYNFIAAAETASGQAVILKMGVPNPELTTEVLALRAYNGRGAARLLDYDSVHSALLLERLSPGTELHRLGNNLQECETAARVMEQITILPPDKHEFPSIAEWVEVFDETEQEVDPQAYGLPVAMLDTARGYAEELIRTTGQDWLLHGDLHHFNILYDEQRGWTAIDPKGVIGDKAYQTARFFFNPSPDLLSMPDPLAVTRQRADIFSERLKLDRQRILRWAYVDCILSACWSIDEGADPEYVVECARLIARLIK